MTEGVAATIVKITSNGQISLPAEIRRRWGVGRVVVLDHDAFAVVRAVPDDPVRAYRGRFAGAGPSSAELRAAEDAADESAASATGR